MNCRILQVLKREIMTEFAAELQLRIADARRALRAAQTAGELDAERIYAGELDSLLHLARENGVEPSPQMPHHPT